MSMSDNTEALTADIKAAVNDLADGRQFPDLLEAIDRLAALAQQAAPPTGWRDVIQQARESIGAGALAENAQHERSVVEPHLDGVYEALDELERTAAQQAAPPAEPVAYADKIAFESAMRAGKGCDVWPKRGDGPREVVALYAAPPAAQAEPAGPGDMAVYQAMADRYAALAARGAQAEPEGGAA